MQRQIAAAGVLRGQRLAGRRADPVAGLHVITDATTGAVLASDDEIETVNGTGNTVLFGPVTLDTTLSGTTYSMVDPSRGGNRTCDMNGGSSTCTTSPRTR